MLTATVDMTAFNAGMRGLVEKCKLSAPLVVKKEAGELIKELIRLSPPKNVKGSKDSIARTVSARFEAAGNRDYLDSRTSPGGIKWTRGTRKLLYGTANELDWRSVSDVEKVRKVYYTIRKTGRQVVPFLKPRKQKVALSRSIFLQSGMVEKVIKRIQKNIGRLRAGWLVSVVKGPIRLSGGKMPPQWVTKHAAGARGRFEDGTAAPSYPSFVIANSAKGISQKGMDFIVSLAVKSRASAMVTNARLMFAGKKKVGDYK